MQGITGPGGGRTGAVLISNRIKPGTVSDKPYNHYSLLRSTEDIFDLNHLGYARAPGVRPFGRDVFTRSRYIRRARGYPTAARVTSSRVRERKSSDTRGSQPGCRKEKANT